MPSISHENPAILIQSTLLVLQSTTLNSFIYHPGSFLWVVLVLWIYSQGFSWHQRIDLHQWEATLFPCRVLTYQCNDEPVTGAAANSLCAESYDARPLTDRQHGHGR